MVSHLLDKHRRYDRTRVSRADLVACLVFGEEQLTEFAKQLGFDIKAKASKPVPRDQDSRPSEAMGNDFEDLVEHKKKATLHKLGFWKIVAHQDKSESEVNSTVPDWFKQVKPIVEDHVEQEFSPKTLRAVPPKPPNLSPPARLWPFLRKALGSFVTTRRLNERALLKIVSKGEPVFQLPRKKKFNWAKQGHVLVDRHHRLIPFWHDFSEAIDLLVEKRGSSGLAVYQFTCGPAGPCRPWFEPLADSEYYPLPRASTPVLVIGDLGIYGTDADRNAWYRFGKYLRVHSLPAIALVCVPPRLWDKALGEVWTPVFWDRGLPLKLQDKNADQFNPSVGNDGVQELLNLLAPSVRVEPALLRAARFLLSVEDVDVGTEYQAWHHSETVHDILAMAFLPSVIGERRQAFASLDKSLKVAFARVLTDFHVHLPFPIRDEERRTLVGLAGTESEELKPHHFMVRVAKSFQSESASLALQDWFRRVFRRQTNREWQDLAMAAAELYRRRLNQEDIEEDLPPGFPLDKVRWVLEGHVEPQDWTVFQVGHKLKFKRGIQQKLDTNSSVGMNRIVLFTTVSRTGYFGFQRGNELVRYKPIREDLEVEVPEIEGESLKFHSDSMVLDLVFQKRPAWASGIGRNQHGLYLELKSSKEKVYWLNPPEILTLKRKHQDYFSKNEILGLADGSTLRSTIIPKDKDMIEYRSYYSMLLRNDEGISLNDARPSNLFVDKGFWYQKNKLKEAGVEIPAWVTYCGIDPWGIHASFSLGDFSYRMRFIPPGEFQMGSPKNEAGRKENESQHTVMLTRGFWLGETTVTQKLWRVVMGTSPSQFRGDQFPVEKVSWTDAQVFIGKLQALVTGLPARLPTEAEWEYACRAGTTTPFFFGEGIDLNRVWHGGIYRSEEEYDNSWPERTIDVESLSKSAWGLKQMHGNIWEWCQDWYGDYADETMVDPTGPAAGEYRLARGGSWVDGARWCRSAYRSRFDPLSRYDYVGFRLAADHPISEGES